MWEGKTAITQMQTVSCGTQDNLSSTHPQESTMKKHKIYPNFKCIPAAHTRNIHAAMNFKDITEIKRKMNLSHVFFMIQKNTLPIFKHKKIIPLRVKNIRQKPIKARLLPPQEIVNTIFFSYTSNKVRDTAIVLFSSSHDQFFKL